MNELVPAVAFPPGEYLKEALGAREWTQAEFAEIIGRTPKLINEIISGKSAITPTTAKEIAAALGGSAIVWLNLEAAYRLHSTVEPPPTRISRQARLRERFAVREMIKRKWITASSDPDILEAQVCKFFGITNIDETPKLAHAAKRTGYPDSLNAPQLAWLFRVKQIAEAMPIKPYSEKALREAIPRLRALLRAPEGVQQVPEVLAECGVRFVIVEHVASSKIDGVTFWLRNGNGRFPVIAMSLRLDRLDNFWFVLRHEIEHVLQGHGRDEAIVDADTDNTATPLQLVSEEEKVASLAGADFCVPDREMADFILRYNPIFSEEKVVNFAKRMQVDPSLVVGQLQKRTGKWHLFRYHLAKVRHLITPIAMTDGYGQVLPLRP
jgi:HTH-type transcriptional regulator/antitoxin HigA